MSEDLYQLMLQCWQIDVDERPTFGEIAPILSDLTLQGNVSLHSTKINRIFLYVIICRLIFLLVWLPDSNMKNTYQNLSACEINPEASWIKDLYFYQEIINFNHLKIDSRASMILYS